MGFQSVAKNSIYLISGQVIAKALAIVSLVWLARYVSVDEYGLLNYALSFWGIVLVFIEGGTGAMSVREVARDHSLSVRYLSATFLFKVIIGFLILPLATVTLWLLGAFDQPLKIWVFVFIGAGQYFLQIMFYTIIVFFRAREAFKFEAVLSVIAALINALLIITAIIIRTKFDFIVLIMFFSNVLIAFIALFTYWNRIEPVQLKVSKTFLVNFAYATIPFSITFIVGGVALKIPVPLIEQYSGTGAVAVYSAAMRIVEGFMFIPGAVGTILYPLFSRSYKKGDSHSVGKLDVILKLVCFISLPVILFSFFFRSEIIFLLYGDKYIETAAIWPIWIMWFFIWSSKSVLALFVLAIDKQKTAVAINLAGFIVTLVLSFMLIPRYSYFGATLSMIIAEMVMFLYVCVYLMKLGYRVFDVGKLSRIVLINLVLTVLAILAKINDPIVASAVFLCCYVTSIFAFKIITSNEKKMLTSLFRRIPNS
ncbi:flippase [bacterium]|nr:flippase [bacterium]